MVIKGIQKIDLPNVRLDEYAGQYVGVIVLTQDKKILLQQRPDHWRSFPGYLATFGGKIEPNEEPIDALVRELHEELGAIVQADEAIFLGTITESISDHRDLIYLYFWSDREGAITGCYECEAIHYDSPADVLKHPKAMQDIFWALAECQQRFLL